MEVGTSPDELTSEVLAEEIAQRTEELVARTRGKDKRSLMLDRFMKEGAKGAAERIYWELFKTIRPVTAEELIRRLKMPRRTVYHTLRKLTDEGWLIEVVDGVYCWQLA